jgi:hypothetical protein
MVEFGGDILKWIHLLVDLHYINKLLLEEHDKRKRCPMCSPREGVEYVRDNVDIER